MRTLLVTALLLSAPLARAQDGVSLPGTPPEPPVGGTSAEAAEPAVAASPAAAGLTAVVPTAPATPAAAPPAPRSGSRFGLLLDTGVPEGIALGVTFRPVPSVRLWAAPAWNYLSFGAQAGVALVPFHWVVSPALSAEVGRFLKADLSRVVNGRSGAPTEVQPLLTNVAYDYGAVHLGFELGSQRGFAFSLRAGLAYLRVKTHGRTEPQSGGAAGDAQVSFADPSIRATIPSVKLGFQYAF